MCIINIEIVDYYVPKERLSIWNETCRRSGKRPPGVVMVWVLLRPKYAL